MGTSYVFFIIAAVVAVATALGMLFSRKATYAALFLILNFSVVAVLYLMLGAPFIALAQISVYAGAIMILFLFVIMLLGTEKLADQEAVRWQRPLAIVLSLILLAEGGYLLLTRGGGFKIMFAQPPADFATPAVLGMTLFSKYLLPFEITSVILLVAVIGAVVLTRADKK